MQVKYDAANFCEMVVGGLNAAGGSLEDVSQYLDQAGGSVDYRWVLIAGLRSGALTTGSWLACS